MSRKAFTLIELLVVIAIIGIVAGLSIPAVQSARESSRRTYCSNQIRQLAKGMIQYESQHRHFPSGGWGKDWLGSAGRNGSDQPSGWVYAVLPFVEEQALYDSISAGTGTAGYVALCNEPGAIFTCPTRRSPQARNVSGTAYKTEFGSVTISTAARTDYCINGGSLGRCAPMTEYYEVIKSLVATSQKVDFCHNGAQNLSLPISAFGAGGGHAGHVDDTLGPCQDCDGAIDSNAVSPDSYPIWVSNWQSKSTSELVLLTLSDDYGLPSLGNGMAHRMSRVTAGNVLDGLSNVYLVGEKYVNEDEYESGDDPGDARPMMVGFSSSTIRWASEKPQQDAGENHPNIFGSAHPGTFNVALGDGSVRSISFDINLDTHKNLAGRSDPGKVLSAF